MKKYTKLSLSEKQKAIKMVTENGVLQKDVADIFNVSHPIVGRWIRGKDMGNQKIALRREKKRPRAIELYEKYGNGSSKLVAKKLGIPHGIVKDWLREEFDLKTSYDQETKNKARALYKEGKSFQAVGRELDVTWGTILIWCEDLSRGKCYHTYSKKTRTKAVSLRKKGWTYHDISKEIGCAYLTSYRWVKEAREQRR